MKLKGIALAGVLAVVAQPATAAEGQKSLQLAKVVLDTETAPIEARVKGGTLCVFPSNIELPKEKKTQDFERYDRLISSHLGQSGVSHVTESGDLFAAESSTKGDVLIGAVMAPTAINICSSVNGYKGTIDVTVEWQFYDRSSESVVARVRTEGTGTVAKFSVNGYEEMWDAAFLDALAQVEAQGVIARVIGTDVAETPATAGTPETEQAGEESAPAS